MPREVVLVEKWIQLQPAASQAFGEVGTTLEMSRKRMKVAWDRMRVFPPRGCSRRLFVSALGILSGSYLSLHCHGTAHPR